MKKQFTFPIVVLLALALILTTVGCKHSTGLIEVNEDSVKTHILAIEGARVFTADFRKAQDSSQQRVKEARPKLDFGLAEAFNRDAVAVLLNQKDADGHLAAGIRIYYGLDPYGRVRMVLVPYDSKGNDIINQLIGGDKAVSIPGISSASAYYGGGQTIEDGQRCPVVCNAGTSGL